MTPYVVLVPLWFTLAILVWTGAAHRWLRARGLGRHIAALAQASVLGLAFAGISSFSRIPDIAQLLLLSSSLVLLVYGGILLRLRWLHLS
jgi:hypothetical protein